MALTATPSYAVVPHIGSAIANATLDTSLTAPTNIATPFTGVAAGSKIEEIVMEALGTTVLGVINVFLFDGSTYHLYDQFLVPIVTSSTTALAWRAARTYTNLILPSASWSLRFAVTIAGLQSLIKCTATGADFT